MKACRLAEQADSPEKPQLALASVRLADFYTTMPSKREVAFSIYKRLPSLVCSIPEKVHDQELTNIDMGRAVFFIGAGIWSKAKRTLERCYERAKHFEYTFLTDSVTLLFTIERVTGDVKGMIQRCGIMQRDFYGHMAFAFLIAGDVEGGKRLLRDYCDEYSSFTFNLRAREEAWQRSTGSLDVSHALKIYVDKIQWRSSSDSASDPSRPDIFLSNLPPTILANTNAAIICVEDGKYSEAVDFALQGLRVFFSEMASSTGAKRFYSLTMAYTCLSAAYQAFCFMDHDHDDVDGDGGGGGGGLVVGGGGSDNGAKKTLARDRKEALAFEKSLAKLSNAVPVLAPLRLYASGWRILQHDLAAGQHVFRECAATADNLGTRMEAAQAEFLSMSSLRGDDLLKHLRELRRQESKSRGLRLPPRFHDLNMRSTASSVKMTWNEESSGIRLTLYFPTRSAIEIFLCKVDGWID